MKKIELRGDSRDVPPGPILAFVVCSLICALLSIIHHGTFLVQSILIPGNYIYCDA